MYHFVSGGLSYKILVKYILYSKKNVEEVWILLKDGVNLTMVKMLLYNYYFALYPYPNSVKINK